MKRIIIIFSVVFIASCSILKKKNVAKIETVPSEIAIKYANTITKEELKEHLSIIASDEYEGRETAMPGQKKAAAYIENNFKEIGLEPGMGNKEYQQSFPVDVKDPSKVKLSIDGKELTFLEDYYYLGNIGDTIFNDREIVYIGYGVDQEGVSDYNGIDVNGKIVLVREGIPAGNDEIDISWGNWRNKIQAASKHGACAMITIQDDFDDKLNQIRSFIENPRMQLHSKGRQQYKKTVPNIYISKKALNEHIDVDNLTESYTGKKAIVDIKTTQVLSSENVLGFIQGTDLKEEIVVITAHYDHIGYDNGEICNGADDDGSGTVSLLEIAEAFALAKKEGNGPRRSMLFMTVSGEEKGLLGSDYYSQNPVYPLENTVVDLNIDMIGRKDSLHDNDNYVYVIGADRISKDLHNISEQINERLIQFKLDYTYNEESDPNHFYYRSDHYNFAKNNIPVIFYFSGVHEDYHKPTDDVEKILFPKLEKTAKLIFFTAWEIANRTQRLRKNA
jgi:hypothetical protein